MDLSYGDQWLELRRQLLISHEKGDTLSRRVCVCVHHIITRSGPNLTSYPRKKKLSRPGLWSSGEEWERGGESRIGVQTAIEMKAGGRPEQCTHHEERPAVENWPY